MRKGGIAAWSIRHPVSAIMLTLTTVVLGFFALGRLAVDLFPHIIYPQIVVRVIDPGVAATIMEDKITRQIEEQLAITEDATAVESSTFEGNSEVTLEFEYGKDIDIALRDASTRLDRAKRFLPTSIDPPVIYKRDPAQIPAMEFVVSSRLRDLVELRTWTDDHFAKQFLNVAGVAAAEVGGGLVREIHVLPDQRRLAGLGLSINDVAEAVKRGNEDAPGGRLRTGQQEFSGRTAGRLTSVAAIKTLPVRLANGESVPLSEVAAVVDSHEEERIRVRFDDNPGIKLAIQKQPNANTVEVTDNVKARLAWMRANGQIPADIAVDTVQDQSIYIRQSLNNATLAAISGAVLAMVVIYLFLGNIRGTLIIGTAIPISIMVTFVIMAVSGLTLNIMSLGGLALGVGMLVDNTIVMLENIARHQHADHLPPVATRAEKREQEVEQAAHAAAEINSAILASTTTNLAAVLPFLFISGLVGLLFRELIVTISAAIVASLLVAVVLVPALAAHAAGEPGGRAYAWVTGYVERAKAFYAHWIVRALDRPFTVVLVAVVLFSVVALPFFTSSREEFLPRMDDGNIAINVTMDPGTAIESMTETVQRIERLARETGSVASVFTLIGGRIFGRTERETPARSGIAVQLVPLADRNITSDQWIKSFQGRITKASMAGAKIRARTAGIRGLRMARSDEEVSVRIQGPDIAQLTAIGNEVEARIRKVAGIRNLEHSLEDVRQEFAVRVDRERAAELGVDVADVGRALRIALEGIIVSDFLQGERSYDIRLRLPLEEVDSPQALDRIVLFGELKNRPAVYLRDVATVELAQAPAEIRRDHQRRIVEVTAALTGDRSLGEVMRDVRNALEGYQPPTGYYLYYSGAEEELTKGRRLSYVLLALALFLVFVVMAVQYESLRNPTIIMLSVPFALIGVGGALWLTGLTLSMPVWLGLIMLAGIVVNNAIVLVEYVEIQRREGCPVREAIIEAGRLRLRPILMTTLTTVVGMMPLALGWGEGAEMLQPLAVTVVAGLSFSLLVSLIFVPVVYLLFNRRAIAA